MTAPALRGYQTAVIERFHDTVARGTRRVLMVAATGSGKTVVAAEIIRQYISQKRRVLFLAHRRELINQAEVKLFDLDIDAGIILAGWPSRPEVPAQIASIQTLYARAVQRSKMNLPPADLLVVDEAHHVRARTYQKILTEYPNAVILGLTATPCRGDGKGLGNVFDVLIECPPVSELINLGYLVPSRVYAPTQPDLQGVQVQRGDYVEKQLAERMDTAELVGDIVTHWHRLAERRKTVIFASGVGHSVHLRNEFQLSGVAAEHIDGGTPKDQRDDILRRLGSGEIELVSNAMVLTEGWDQPDASCCVLARPTRSLGLYRQMVGRVLRPANSKSDALILDHAGAVFQHGFPEDDVLWTLDEDKRAENAVHVSRSLATTSRLTTCPECSAIRTAGEACRSCGWEPKRRPVQPDIADGELGRVDRHRQVHPDDYDNAARDRWHRELAYIAEDRGYKSGWTAYKFKEKFGVYPPWGEVEPIQPSAEVLSWVRSRNIAFAKAMARAS